MGYSVKRQEMLLFHCKSISGLFPDGVVGPQTDAILGRAGMKYPQTSRGSNERVSNYDIVKIANEYLGSPYIYGGTSPRRFDCSGFVQYVYNMAGKKIGRSTYEQYVGGRSVSTSNLEPGDILFFSTSGNGPTHEGIYIGNNQLIHMGTSLNKATIVNFSGWFRQYYIGAKRYY